MSKKLTPGPLVLSLPGMKSFEYSVLVRSVNYDYMSGVYDQTTDKVRVTFGPHTQELLDTPELIADLPKVLAEAFKRITELERDVYDLKDEIRRLSYGDSRD